MATSNGFRSEPRPRTLSFSAEAPLPFRRKQSVDWKAFILTEAKAVLLSTIIILTTLSFRTSLSFLVNENKLSWITAGSWYLSSIQQYVGVLPLLQVRLAEAILGRITAIQFMIVAAVHVIVIGSTVTCFGYISTLPLPSNESFLCIREDSRVPFPVLLLLETLWNAFLVAVLLIMPVLLLQSTFMHCRLSSAQVSCVARCKSMTGALQC